MFYYVEPPAPLPHAALGVFVLINQVYFMGACYLISGYFTPDSYERTAPGVFYKGRLLRLGIPLVAYVLILGPIASFDLYQAPARYAHLSRKRRDQDLSSTHARPDTRSRRRGAPAAPVARVWTRPDRRRLCRSH